MPMDGRGDGNYHLPMSDADMLKRGALEKLNMLWQNHHEGQLRHHCRRGGQLLAVAA